MVKRVHASYRKKQSELVGHSYGLSRPRMESEERWKYRQWPHPAHTASDMSVGGFTWQLCWSFLPHSSAALELFLPLCPPSIIQILRGLTPTTWQSLPKHGSNFPYPSGGALTVPSLSLSPSLTALERSYVDDFCLCLLIFKVVRPSIYSIYFMLLSLFRSKKAVQ